MKKTLFILSFVLSFSPLCSAAEASSPTTVPHFEPVKVAFVLSENAVPIDFAGPWDVFSSVHLPDHGQGMDARMPFKLYTVGASTATIHTSGNHHPGMAITPDYSFDSAPEPDIVVVPAESGAPGLSAWLQELHARHKTIVSICTGTFKLAAAGLLDGKTVTTHHGAIQELAERYPKLHVVSGVRFVQADDRIYTSAGLSAGIDLALHIVDQRYGRAVAQQAANVLEYEGTGWKRRASPQSKNQADKR
jgi:transcriptional regulator GlxA family with amidase domain